MSASLVIFDLDGTVINAFYDIQAALNHALAAHGLPGHDIQTVRSFVGNGLVRLCERALPPGAQEKLDDVVAETRRYYSDHPVDHAQFYPGMREAIQDLHRLGFATAVLSNKVDDLVQRIAEEMKLDDLFDAVAGERDGIAIKPDPAGLFALRDELGAERIVFVGDGMPDAEVAQRAEVPFIGVPWGISTRETLEPFGHVISQAEELPGAVMRALEA